MSILQKALLILLMLVLASPLSAATVDVKTLKTLSLPATPRDVAATADGKRIYVLNQDGAVQIYSVSGQLIGDFPAGADVTGITPQGPDLLILEKPGRQELTLVSLEMSEEIDVSNSPSLGPADAPVSIVVFDDFECPYCAKAVPLLKQIQQAYPQQSKLVFKNFPLKMHRNAEAAAIAGLAADRQGKFWPYHDLLFEHFNRLNPQKISELAKQAGLDMARFEMDRKDPALMRQVQADISQGRNIGVRGTPTLFINGRRVQQRSFDEMSRMIEEELKALR
ncbi:MAG: thioredoxin domain-containing protein [Desulfuromonadales bacterium]|nr:thioredoxin domain-containing protein [Desulfuromonadales bacterium]